MLNDPLANVLSIINNYEQIGKRELIAHPWSSIIADVLSILKTENYIGEFEQITDQKGGIYKIQLLGNVNKCGVIKPRFSVKLSDFEKFEKRYLPAKGMGMLILSTSQGLMTQDKARELKIGGRLIAFCY